MTACLADGTAREVCEARWNASHETNPEVALVLELWGGGPRNAGWRYALARMSSASISVSLDGRGVRRWPQGKRSTAHWIHRKPYAPEQDR